MLEVVFNVGLKVFLTTFLFVFSIGSVVLSVGKKAKQ
jgi:hypothetical protein